MHYYQFNIGDYYSHTHHLDDLEDLAYRKMIDYCYLNEWCLPDKVEIIARKIGMRSHIESITNVLQEFFELGEYGYFQPRIMRDIEKYKAKSEKAKASANARWAKKPIKSDANALQADCEGNANQEPITINHKPVTNLKDLSPDSDHEAQQSFEDLQEYEKTQKPKPKNGMPRNWTKDLVEAYHECLPDWPRVEIINDDRKKAANRAYKFTDDSKTIEFWKGMFLECKGNAFMEGVNDRGWKANFDYLLTNKAMVKIYEGNQPR